MPGCGGRDRTAPLERCRIDMQSDLFRDILWYAGIALDAALALRLFQLRLAKRYPVLSLLLCFSVGRSLGLAYLRHDHQRLFGLSGYSLAYFITQPAVWVLYFLLVLELYSRMLEEYPGIRRLGRVVLLSALASVTLACAAVILVDHQAGFDRYPFISYLILQDRSVYLSLSTLILLLLLFVAHYRIPIRRNVWILYCSFGGYFVAEALLYTLRRYFGSAFAPVRDLAGALFYLALLVGAVLLFSPAGETESRPATTLWEGRRPELETALSVQLQGFNQALVRALR
ncbi:MAG TPA: hypothetical protein VEU62_22895 [Bryobacterales bacterium]|nr:hypothetical protein [Bryobacterales bacterium]